MSLQSPLFDGFLFERVSWVYVGPIFGVPGTVSRVVSPSAFLDSDAQSDLPWGDEWASSEDCLPSSACFCLDLLSESIALGYPHLAKNSSSILGMVFCASEEHKAKASNQRENISVTRRRNHFLLLVMG